MFPLGTLNEDGVYKNSGTKYKQYNFRSNLDAKITDYFSLGSTFLVDRNAEPIQQDRRVQSLGC